MPEIAISLAELKNGKNGILLPDFNHKNITEVIFYNEDKQ